MFDSKFALLVTSDSLYRFDAFNNLDCMYDYARMIIKHENCFVKPHKIPSAQGLNTSINVIH